MKRIFWLCGIAALAYSCSNADSDDQTQAPTTPPESLTTLPLTIQAAAGSYAADQGMEQVPVVFREGDAIGLFALRKDNNGETQATRMKLTLGNDGQWSAPETLEYSEGDRYFACYPWQESIANEPVDADASDDESFFAEMIARWEPAADQSSPEKFAAAALMTATGTVVTSDDKASLSLQFTPRMALVGITFPKTVYKFTNSPAIADYVIPASNPVFEGFTPYHGNDGLYLYQVNPKSDDELKGSFGSDETWNLTAADNKAGNLTLHTVGTGNTEKQHLLQAGDFFLADGNLLPKDTDAATVAAQTVVGIVYQIDPERISAEEKEALGGTVHGQVISCQQLAPANTDDSSMKWCTYAGGDRDESSIGLNPVPDPAEPLQTNIELANNAINGYYNTTQIFSRRADELERYPLFEQVRQFASTTNSPTPAFTTGWYLPSIGQWFDVIRTLGGYDLATDSPEISSYGNITFYWQNSSNIDIVGNLNKAMEKINNNAKAEYNTSSSNFFWTSSITGNSTAYNIGINPQTSDPDIDMRFSAFSSSKSRTDYKSRLILCF